MARLISNSGGRTSGLMTWREIQAGLGPDDFICFANTGKEKEETLQFIHDQETHWNIKIYWLEYCRWNGWKEVNFKTASRNGEPFLEAYAKKRMLPNIATRWCTQELKIRVMKKFMRSMGFNTWENLVGLRYDEQRRVSNNKAGKDKQRYFTVYPLYSARLTVTDVMEFWQKQPFDLQLQPHQGNCDLCFMKGKGKRLDILQKNPEVGDWWNNFEIATGCTFSKRDSVSQLITQASRLNTQTEIDFYSEIDCSCTD